MKILLADDHGLFRDSMAVWLQQLPSDVQIDTASDGHELNRKLDNSFDLVLMDLGMPGMSGAESVREIHAQYPEIPILIVSANDDAQTIQTCMLAGASGYITKASTGDQILGAVNAILAGGSWIPASGRKNQYLSLADALSKKQIQLLAHLANGESNREIADKMFLSEGTVKQYVSQLLHILDVDNRTQAGNKARQILGINDH